VTLLDNSTGESTWAVDEVNPSILYEVAEEFDVDYNFDPVRYVLTLVGKTTMRFVAIRSGQTPLRIVHRQPETVSAYSLAGGFTGDRFEINVMVEDN